MSVIVGNRTRYYPDSLGVGPAWPTCAASGKNVSTAVSVAFGGGNTALTVAPAKVDALPPVVLRGTATTITERVQIAQRRPERMDRILL